MFKQILSLALVALLINLVAINCAYAIAVQGSDARAVEKVKEEVGKRGTGPKARVEVRFRDGTKLKGYISEARDDHFTVVDAAGHSTRVDYSQVKSVKSNNRSFFDVKEIAIAAGLIGGIFLVVLFYVSQTK